MINQNIDATTLKEFELPIRTSALKQIFMKMNLFKSNALNDKFISLGEKIINARNNISDEIVQELRALVEELPSIQQKALRGLIDIFVNVSNLSSINEMGVNNLCISCKSIFNFTPIANIQGLTSEEAAALMQQNAKALLIQNAVLSTLIRFHSKIFS